MLERRTRIYATNVARRLISCGVTQYIRVVTPDADATRIMCTNKRACRIRICAQCEYRRSCAVRRKLVAMFDQVWNTASPCAGTAGRPLHPQHAACLICAR